MKERKRNPKMWLMCGQHINASDEKCTDLKRHGFTEFQYAQTLNRQPAPLPLKMEYEYSGEPITPEMLQSRLGISLFHARRIVRAVNMHESLLADAKSSAEWFAANGYHTEAININRMIERARQ